MRSIYLSSLILLLFAFATAFEDELSCSRIDFCRCSMSDSSGVVNLRSLGRRDNTPRWTVEGNDGFQYMYNPCYGWNTNSYTNLAVLQSNRLLNYDLGVQPSETFNFTSSKGLVVSYSAREDGGRLSTVTLECDDSSNDHSLEFVGELNTGEYDFILRGPCACAGKCDDDGLIGVEVTTIYPPVPTPTVGCTRLDSCRCQMEDDSGIINLRSIASQDGFTPAWIINGGDGWFYQVNPCFGFYSYSSYTYEQAVYQAPVDNLYGYGYDLGVQGNEKFIFEPNDGISLVYNASDGVRTSIITLICEPNADTHSLKFIGELMTLEYEFTLSGPCACPGLCDDNGKYDPNNPTEPPPPVCLSTDSCKCTMSDGSGSINLRSIGKQGANAPAFETGLGSDGYSYQYNPCYPFTSVITETQTLYDLAVLQRGYGYGYDLGVQSSETFGYDPLSGVSLTYTAGDLIRKSRVTLVCDASRSDHSLEFVGELITTEYDFILTGPCACFDTCDDNGLIPGITVPPVTVPIPTSQCNKLDTCKCSMADGTGIINLRSTGSQTSTPKYVLIGSDLWEYSFNPCYGWQDAAYGYTDLAILQTSSYGYGGYDLGVQSSETFVFEPSTGISLAYQAADALRKSKVRLVCEPNALTHNLEFIGELVTTEYEFIFTGPCACPGRCDDYGVIGQDPVTTTVPLPPQLTTFSYPVATTTCEKSDVCKCTMADNSGDINLRSVGLKNGSPKYVIAGTDSWSYSYNPCYGFSSTYFTDLAVLQEDQYGSGLQFDLGIQSQETFTYSSATGLQIAYLAKDKLRQSLITLICQPDTKEHKLEFLGELITTQYEFILTGPCICPGLCDDNGIINSTNNQPPQPIVQTTGLKWEEVGADIVSLIFHDLILIFCIIVIIVILQVFFNIRCCRRKPGYSSGLMTGNF